MTCQYLTKYPLTPCLHTGVCFQKRAVWIKVPEAPKRDGRGARPVHARSSGPLNELSMPNSRDVQEIACDHLLFRKTKSRMTRAQCVSGLGTWRKTAGLLAPPFAKSTWTVPFRSPEPKAWAGGAVGRPAGECVFGELVGPWERLAF